MILVLRIFHTQWKKKTIQILLFFCLFLCICGESRARSCEHETDQWVLGFFSIERARTHTQLIHTDWLSTDCCDTANAVINEPHRTAATWYSDTRDPSAYYHTTHSICMSFCPDITQPFNCNQLNLTVERRQQSEWQIKKISTTIINGVKKTMWNDRQKKETARRPQNYRKLNWLSINSDSIYFVFVLFLFPLKPTIAHSNVCRRRTRGNQRLWLPAFQDMSQQSHRFLAFGRRRMRAHIMKFLCCAFALWFVWFFSFLLIVLQHCFVRYWPLGLEYLHRISKSLRWLCHGWCGLCLCRFAVRGPNAAHNLLSSSIIDLCRGGTLNWQLWRPIISSACARPYRRIWNCGHSCFILAFGNRHALWQRVWQSPSTTDDCGLGKSAMGNAMCSAQWKKRVTGRGLWWRFGDLLLSILVAIFSSLD